MVNLPGGEDKKQEAIDIGTARLKIARYCTYQERAHSEIEQKLYSYKLGYDDVHELLAWLITENYLNEERFAIAFAGGKFRLKKWGKIKIKQHLQQKKVSEFSISTALAKINKEDYWQTIEYLITKKSASTTAKNVFELRNKIARYVIGKGFESELVWEQTKTIVH